MAAKLSDLKPNVLWQHFSETLKIPHGSGNEKALGDYIISLAKRLDLEWKRDEVGNVVVSKKASAGYEDSVGVIIQGHLDMVCEKNSDLDFDFLKDEIEAVVEGDWVHAKGTTLGADNGIGNCAGLAIMEDNSLTHPPLEFLFTVEEETGLKGASSIQPGFLKGKRLLNLDSEDEGEFTDSQISLPLTRVTGEINSSLQIYISGFQGGHSGVDINLGRGNAVKLMARLLWETYPDAPFQLIELHGGNLRNAIPRESWAIVSIPDNKIEEFQTVAEKVFAQIKDEFKTTDPDAKIAIQKSSEKPALPLDPVSQQKLLNLVFSLPHGVVAMHSEIEGLVETSTNLAVVNIKADKAEIICSTRSSIASALEATRGNLAAICELAGGTILLEEGYPGWKPNLQSFLLKKLKEQYKDMFQTEAHIAAIHAGLECGIIGDKFPGMDMISFGPTIKFPHSPGEKVHIGSVEKFWTFLIGLLAELN